MYVRMEFLKINYLYLRKDIHGIGGTVKDDDTKDDEEEDDEEDDEEDKTNM